MHNTKPFCIPRHTDSTHGPYTKTYVDHMLMTETIQFSSGFAAWQ
jgi:hypothetical protein